MRIGFETSQHEGPGIFMSRLRAVLEKQGLFSESDPDVWIQLSFHKLPPHVAERRTAGKTKVVVRMDGAYCGRSYKIHKPFVVPVKFLDDAYSAKVNRKKNALLRENLLAADEIIFQSEFSHRLTQHFVTPTKAGHIVYNGIDIQHFAPNGPKSTLINTDAISILMSHSYRPYHRLHGALKILARLKTQLSRPVRLYVLGGDEGKTLLDAKARLHDEGLEEGKDIVFLGKQPFNELAPIYRACDFMLNLSYWDTCPNVVIEAMACGLPVAGVNHGGVAELVGKQGGVLVDENIPFDYLDHQNPDRMVHAPVAAYASAVQILLNDRTRYAASARQRAETHFNIEQTARQYMEVAQSLTTPALR